MTRVLYVHSRKNTFTEIDRAALAERFEADCRPTLLCRRRARLAMALGPNYDVILALGSRRAATRRRSGLLLPSQLDRALITWAAFGLFLAALVALLD